MIHQKQYLSSCDVLSRHSRIVYGGLFLFFLSIAYSTFACAQDPPITWGDVPRTDLEMKSFLPDTNASALILCDYGESSFNNDLNIVFQRHLRVKIFSAQGYEWGNHIVSIYTGDGTEQIDDIEGVTYVLDEQNAMVKNELKNNDIFKENVDNKRTRYRFTLPGLKPGCVIEIRYTIESTSLWFMRNWIFQHNEPVRWSEYRIRCPKAIAYATVTSGYEPFSINEIQDASQVFSGSAVSYLGKNIVECSYMRWVVQNAPALRNEPYITTMDDYYSKVDVQLAGYAFAGGGVKQVMNTWSSLIEELLKSEYFSKKIDDTRRVRQRAEEITSGITIQEEKLKAIYDWVAQSIVWSGENRRAADQDVNDVLESKKGNNAEITFLLLSLLKSVGIEGDPVILSTRNNGIIQDLYPILSQFNYVLARVSLESQYYYLDATNPIRPMELLPAKVLNVRGLVIKQGNPEWITLTSSKRYINASLALIDLHEDGSLKGTLEDVYREYASMFRRSDLKDRKDIDVAKETFDTEPVGIAIDSVQVESRDSIQAPLKMKAWVSSPTYAQSNGDLLYVNPHLLHRNRENPFKVQNRKFPIDYSYRRSYNTNVILTLPDGFEVKESLGNLSFNIGSDIVTYTRTVLTDSNQIRIAVTFDIREIEIRSSFYQRLRDFYAQIVAAESEQLVLARIKKPIAPTPKAKTFPKKGKK